MMRLIKGVAYLTMWVVSQQRSDEVRRVRDSGGIFSKHSVVVLIAIFQSRHLK